MRTNKPMKRKILKIDPRIFISPPFIKCPKCNKLNSFGVLMISGHHYTRRCRECWFTETYKLPEMKKKIVYLDQFVISNMMKAINQKLGKVKKVDPFWLKLFEKLDRLVKLQIIICPDSTFHRNESLLSYYQALKRMYEHLSGGATFYDPSTIRRFQIAEYFKQFIAGV
jgi:transcription elongation factor Elf1